MALTAAVLQSCSMCFSEKCLRSAIVLEAKRGYRNALVGNMRFSNFLCSKLPKLCFRSKHKFAEKLLEEVDGYERASIFDRPRLLSKVSVWMGYDGLDDLVDKENAKQEFLISLKGGSDDFDVSLACKQFPSITLGFSTPVQLYDDGTYCSWNSGLSAAHLCEEFLPSSVGTNWADLNCFYKSWESRNLKLANESSSTLTEDVLDGSSSNLIGDECDTSSTRSQWSNMENKSREDTQYIVDKSFSSVELETQQSAASVELVLDRTINCIPGLSKRQFRQLENCGFHTFRKLLHHFPRTYADLQNADVGIEDGQYLIFAGKILSSRGIKASYSFSFLEVVVACEIAEESTSECLIDGDEANRGKKRTIYLHLKQFFRGTRFTYQPFLRSIQEKYKEGDIVCVSGKVRARQAKDHYEMKEYNIDTLEGEEDSSLCAEGKLYPIHPSKGGLKPNFLRDIISRALKMFPANLDPIPRDIIQEFGLFCLNDAYLGIHQPKNLKEADLARKRLIFDEFFFLQLGKLFQMLEGLGTEFEKDALLERYRKPELNAVFIEEWSSLTKRFLKTLPYALTPSQLRAVSEIIWDLKRPVPMNRLLQGDVGCGKTVVAFLACVEVIGAGYQAAFMVPTELLAIQHYEHFLGLLENMEEVDCKPSIALLTGSTPSKQSRLIRKGLQAGEISLVIGTHSLIADGVEFSALRIAVVDEQHRFGVIQRGRFNSKLYNSSIISKVASSNADDLSKGSMHMAPHVLAMSATPIPRTLALALYGDMSLTQITDLPPGRLPVETFIIEGNETGFEKVYQMMLDELEAGGKVYLVYPVIEQSEQLPQLRAASADLGTISSRFPGYSCGLLHGKMKSDEKDEALRRFRSGETNILLSTQIIEIGVDVPDASMMVVMNAERFGLAQLHQLRGRVGRGERKSKCTLLASTKSSLNRLKVLQESSDGFHLANMDLILRGPGDLLGKKQSGHLPEFPIARLEIDGNIIQDAHLAALKILGNSHDLDKFPDLKGELSMRQPLCLLGD